MAGYWANDGLRLALQLMLEAGVTLHLFVDPIAPTAAGGAKDLTEPSDAGYKPVTLPPSQWTVRDGMPVLALGQEQVFEFDGEKGAQTIRGYFLTCRGELVAAEVFKTAEGVVDPITVKTAGSQVKVQPMLSLGNRTA